MSTTLPRTLLRLAYERAEQKYLRSLPPEHFMESVPQATQRKITIESLDLVHARRPDVQFFNELLVQYPLPRQSEPGQVVPDNMVVVHDQPLVAKGSYNLPFQPVGPFWMLEYVSESNKRKDYEDNFRKYERELKVPYYLLFYPDGQELTLYHLKGRKYVSVKPNEQGRYAIPELELELALLDDWVRYWYRGTLLPLPADLQRDLDEAHRLLGEAIRRAEEEKQRADEQMQRAEEQTRRAEEQTRRVEDERRRADEQMRRAEDERQARLALERELAELRGQQPRRKRNGGTT
ncbi:MAG TPA: Uma2 family endonuclease [Gemmataceae bacterium]|nr:Uma2 family endonuclease [Gemmataceae bacterium]